MSSPDPINKIETAEEWAATRAKLEGKTAEELFAATLDGDYDDNALWAAVTVLRLRGTPEVFEMARQWCQSENPKARARGLDVLAQLGAGKPDEERPFMDESVSIAISRLGDSSPTVVKHGTPVEELCDGLRDLLASGFGEPKTNMAPNS